MKITPYIADATVVYVDGRPFAVEYDGTKWALQIPILSGSSVLIGVRCVENEYCELISVKGFTFYNK